jgi:hypothetical protein
MIPVGKGRKASKPFTSAEFAALYRRIDQPTAEDAALRFTATERRAAMDRMDVLKDENPAYLGNLIAQANGSGFGYVLVLLAAETRDYAKSGA